MEQLEGEVRQLYGKVERLRCENDELREMVSVAAAVRDELANGYDGLKDLYESRRVEVERLRSEHRWIPVRERLPEPDNGETAYLVIESDGEYTLYDVCFYLTDDGWFEPGTGGHNDGDAWYVIYWQPLPPLPEEATWLALTPVP